MICSKNESSEIAGYRNLETIFARFSHDFWFSYMLRFNAEKFMLHRFSLT